MVSFRTLYHVILTDLTILGMNDVLPKPFTKEGLLHMLEKHLVHLKKNAPHADTMVAPQPLAVTRQVLKEEESPSKSPGTASNWNSPNQIPGVSPVGSEEYMHAATYAHPLQGYNTASQLDIQRQQQAAAAAAAGHRRQISNISGGEDLTNPAKRQQIYGAPIQPTITQMPRPR
jgi:osomolarity two-component system response regulator SKN7